MFTKKRKTLDRIHEKYYFHFANVRIQITKALISSIHTDTESRGKGLEVQGAEAAPSYLVIF